MKLSFSLLVLDGSLVPDGSRLKKLCVGWVSWREGRVTPTLFSAALSMHWTVLQQDTLQAPYPYSDAASQDSSVEGAHDRSQGSGSSRFVEEVEMLLSFLGQCCGALSPGEVFCKVHTQELDAVHSLHSRTFDGQRSILSVYSPDVNTPRNVVRTRSFSCVDPAEGSLNTVENLIACFLQ